MIRNKGSAFQKYYTVTKRSPGYFVNWKKRSHAYNMIHFAFKIKIKWVHTQHTHLCICRSAQENGWKDHTS